MPDKVRSVVIEYIVPEDTFDALTLFLKPNTKSGYIYHKVDCATHPTVAFNAGLIISHLMNTLPKDGKAFQTNAG